MSTVVFDEDERTMLVLALLAYRGFEKSSLVAPNASVVAEEIAKGLATLKILRREWALAWGPVTHRPPLGIFDDSLVYVVRHRAEPSRYVIAVRGTNPISSFDWLFGDLWAGHQTPWLYGARRDSPEARVSEIGRAHV